MRRALFIAYLITNIAYRVLPARIWGSRAYVRQHLGMENERNVI